MSPLLRITQVFLSSWQTAMTEAQDFHSDFGRRLKSLVGVAKSGTPNMIKEIGTYAEGGLVRRAWLQKS